jgi:hypothetical protein
VYGGADGCGDPEAPRSECLAADAELAELMAAWPQLSEEHRAALLTTARAMRGASK